MCGADCEVLAGEGPHPDLCLDIGNVNVREKERSKIYKRPINVKWIVAERMAIYLYRTVDKRSLENIKTQRFDDNQMLQGIDRQSYKYKDPDVLMHTNSPPR